MSRADVMNRDPRYADGSGCALAALVVLAFWALVALALWEIL